MSNARQPSGLMETADQDNLAQLKKELLGENQPKRSLNYKVGALSDKDRNTLIYIAKQALMMMRMKLMTRGYSDETYDTVVGNINRSVSPDLKRIIVEVLEEIQPVPVREKPLKQYDGSSIYNDPTLFPQSDEQNNQGHDSPNKRGRKNDRKAVTSSSSETVGVAESNYNSVRTALLNSKYTTQSSDAANKTFLDKLVESESSRRSDAEITLDDGRKFVGKLQFGKARLKDYQKATGTSFTQEDFKENLALQDRVAAWHLEDLAKAVDELGDAAKGYSKEGLLAVGHLGGKSGMEQFVKSKGQYDPEDALGTSLSEYYNKFSGAA